MLLRAGKPKNLSSAGMINSSDLNANRNDRFSLKQPGPPKIQSVFFFFYLRQYGFAGRTYEAMALAPICQKKKKICFICIFAN